MKVPNASKETYLYEKRPVHMKRNLQKSPVNVPNLREQRPVQQTYLSLSLTHTSTRSLSCGVSNVSKETHPYEKRPIKETFI